MKYFDSIEDLQHALTEANPAGNILELRAMVEGILLKHIKSDIYDAYTPMEHGWVGGQTYQRRHVLEQNIETFFEKDGTMVTTSVAKPDRSIGKRKFSSSEKGAFLRLIEGDSASDYPLGIWSLSMHGFPRPAVSNAQKEVDQRIRARKSSLQSALEREMSKL